MEKQLVRKISTVSFLGFGLLGWIVTSVLLRTLAGMFGTVQRLHGTDLFAHGLPVAVGAIIFIYLQFNPRVLGWAELVILEISKVVWPTQKDTVGMTIVTLIMLFIASVVLMTFDWIAGSIMGIIIG